MKLFFSLFSLCPLFILAELISVDEKKIPLVRQESRVLELLIEQGEKKLERQRTLREKMEQFEQQKSLFIAGDQTKKHAFLMVSTARDILGMIKEDHLGYLFSLEYLDELLFFSSIAGKTAPVRP